MFEPMSARFASSCSRNGISDAATDTICLGDTSMKSTLPAQTHGIILVSNRNQVISKLALFVELRVRLRNDVLTLFDRRKIFDVSVALPLTTFRYGVSRKP